MIFSNEDTWILTIIYNSQVLSEHKRLWKSLSKIIVFNSSWLLNGDFNVSQAMRNIEGENLEIMLQSPLFLKIYL